MTNSKTLTKTVKHPQHIACIPAALVEHRENGLVDYELKNEDLIFAQRSMLEENHNYRQFLPLAIFTHKGKVWAYKRLAGIGEDDLVNRIACAVGGHWDLESMIETESVIDIDQSILSTFSRELEEEVNLNCNIINTREMSKKICADDEIVDRKHMCSITVFEVDAPDIETAEDELESIGFHDPQELLDGNYNLETWAKIICKLLISEKTK